MRRWLSTFSSAFQNWKKWWIVHLGLSLSVVGALYLLRFKGDPEQFLFAVGGGGLFLWALLCAHLASNLKPGRRVLGVLARGLVIPVGIGVFLGNPWTVGWTLQAAQGVRDTNLILMSLSIAGTYLSCLLSFALILEMGTNREGDKSTFQEIILNDIRVAGKRFKAAWRSAFNVLAQISLVIFPAALLLSFVSFVISLLPYVFVEMAGLVLVVFLASYVPTLICEEIKYHLAKIFSK